MLVGALCLEGSVKALLRARIVRRHAARIAGKLAGDAEEHERACSQAGRWLQSAFGGRRVVENEWPTFRVGDPECGEEVVGVDHLDHAVGEPENVPELGQLTHGEDGDFGAGRDSRGAQVDWPSKKCDLVFSDGRCRGRALRSKKLHDTITITEKCSSCGSPQSGVGGHAACSSEYTRTANCEENTQDTLGRRRTSASRACRRHKQRAREVAQRQRASSRGGTGRPSSLWGRLDRLITSSTGGLDKIRLTDSHTHNTSKHDQHESVTIG